MESLKRVPSFTVRFTAVLMLAAVVLTACGGPAGESWPGLSSSGTSAEFGNTVFVAYGDRIVALDAVSGARRWIYPAEDQRDSRFFAKPVIDSDNQTLYVGDFKGQLHAVNIENGTARWVYTPPKEDRIGPFSTTPDDRVFSGVALGTDKVYFGLASRNVVALPRGNGGPSQAVWTFRTDHGVWSTPLYVQGEQGAAPVLYVVSLDHYFYALDANSGQELWSLDLGGAAPGNMTYDAVHHWVYIGTLNSKLLLIDLNSRKILNTFEAQGWIWGGPALESAEAAAAQPDASATQEAATAEPTAEATETPDEDATNTTEAQNDVLYFGDLEGNLYAVAVTDAGEFQPLWQKKIAEAAIRATPVITDGLIIVGSKDKRVYAVAKDTGEKQWDQLTKGEVLSDMVLAPGDDAPLVVVSTSDSEEFVIAFQSDSGERRWSYSAE